MRIAPNLSFSLDRNPRLRYVPALDGLRALAIIAVMLFHLKTKSLFPGGGLGVDLFFVLSGFLITTLLLQEWAATRTISLKAFYQRRVLRLFPAVAVFVLTYVVVNLAFSAYDFTGRQSNELLLRSSALIATYGFNWLIAFGGVAGSGLSHLWSLSVEEQFYLVWPALLLLLLKARVPAVAIMGLSILIAVGSASLPFVVDGDWNRFYYGTDFRLQGLMLGSLIGQLYVAGILKSQLTRRPSFVVALAVAIALLVAMVLLGRSEAGVLFHGGHTLVALCSGTLILGAMFGDKNVFNALLSHPIFVYIGKRSYALYLWHAALNVWLQSVPAVPHFLLTVTLSFAAAELSYRLVEAPALRLKARLGKSQPAAAALSPSMPAETNPSVAA